MRDKETSVARVLRHASGDKRFKILEAQIKKFQGRQDALIEVLHKAQELFGFLEDDLLLFVAYRLKLPPSRVYGVATFYHFFTLKPQGAHTCVVCLGTACYVKGSAKVLAAAEAAARIKAGETTAGQPALAADGPLHRRLRDRAGGGLRRPGGGQADHRRCWPNSKNGENHASRRPSRDRRKAPASRKQYCLRTACPPAACPRAPTRSSRASMRP